MASENRGHQALSRVAVEAMPEPALRIQVCVPLLKAHGFHGVFLWHGGSGELGKDVVGWKLNPRTGELDGIAIVAKAKKPTGNNQLHDIAGQVAQALNTPFRDKHSGEMVSVRKVWVVINKELAKETSERFWATISAEYRDSVELIDLDRLWEKHIVPRLLGSTVQIMDDAQRAIQELDSPYRISVESGDGKRVLTIGEKYPGQAEVEPLRGRIGFMFPDTPEGRAKREELAKLFATGAPITLTAEFIREFALPEEAERLTRELFGDQEFIPTCITISSTPNPASLPVSIDMLAEDGERVTLPYVELRRTQAGTDEVTFTNDHQFTPHLVTLIVNLKNQIMRLTISRKDGDIAVSQYDQSLSLIVCLYKAGRIVITDLRFGIVLTDAWHENNPEGSPVDQGLKRVISSVAKASSIAGTPIVLPDREWTDNEYGAMVEVDRIVRNGVITEVWDRLNVGIECTCAQAEATIDQFKHGMMLRALQTVAVNLFGQELPLGSVQQTAKDVVLCNADEIRAAFVDAADEEIRTTFARFTPRGDRNITSEYLRWLPMGDNQ